MAATDEGTAVADDTGTGPGMTTAVAESSESGTEPDAPALPFAHGIRLNRMTANQAVQVELVADGIEVAEADYNHRIISGRTTLLRAFWSLHADFVPRELIGRLVADYPDGTQLVQDFPLMVQGDSDDGGASFQWLLNPDQVVPGILYRVKILEATVDGAKGELTDPPPILPLAGRGTLGVYDVPLEIEVVLVPVLHQWEGERCMPEIGERDVTALRELLEENNPVQEAIVTVGDPMPYTASIAEGGSFSPVLSALAEHRVKQAPGPQVYFYGLIDSCDGFPPGLGGQALGIPPIPPTPELAGMRVSAGRWSGSGQNASGTFVHEIGHNQGRYHVLCSGGEAGADMAYPHPNGRIGVWGFGIHDFELHSASGSRDYMTYCSNEWVSDYSWELTLGVIEILTSWARADVAPMPQGPGLLYGALYADGSEDWWTGPGALPAAVATPEASLLVHGPGGEQTLPAWIFVRPDDDTVQVIAPRPDLGVAAAIDLVDPGRVAPSPVPMAEIRDHVITAP